MAKEKDKTELPQVIEGELKARLIKLREDAGYDLSQMADALCLSEDVVSNLESESFDLLPEPPYVRGYLRNYAKLGEEDPNELIRRYEALRGGEFDEPEYQLNTATTLSTQNKKSMSPVWAQLILLGVLLGAIALIFSIPAVNTWVKKTWQSVSSEINQNGGAENPSLLGNLPVPTPLPEDVATQPQQANQNTQSANNGNSNNNTANTQNAPMEPNTVAESPNTTSSQTTNQQAPVTPTQAAQPSNQTSTTTQTENAQADIAANTPNSTTETPSEIPASNPDGTINIKMVFNKEVWLRIKDGNNKTVFEGLNKAATEKVLDHAKPLTFRVGNAQGLSLFIDNRPVDISSYINGSIANFTLE